jgi:hypothetical protein
MLRFIVLTAASALWPILGAAPAPNAAGAPAAAIQQKDNTSTVDLVQVQLLLPKKVRVGKTFTVMDEVENQGESVAQNSLTGYFLSQDDEFDEKDLLVGGRRVPALAGRQSNSTMTPVTIKAPVPPGDYYFIALADLRHDLEERYRNNNTRAAKVTVEAAKKKD